MINLIKNCFKIILPCPRFDSDRKLMDRHPFKAGLRAMDEFNDREYPSTNRADPCRLEIREKSRRQTEGGQPPRRLQFPLRGVCNSRESRYFTRSISIACRAKVHHHHNFNFLISAFKFIRV